MTDIDPIQLGTDFVRTVLVPLVDYPEELSVSGRLDGMGVLVEVHTHPEDLGRVIGKSGATITAIRTTTRALGSKHGARIYVKVLEDA